MAGTIMSQARIKEVMTAPSTSKEKGPPDGTLVITTDTAEVVEWRGRSTLHVAECSSTFLDDEDDGPRPHELYGKITWKIPNFTEAKTSKRELRSPVFEIGVYKWYILLYPNGCDVCDHLSLFLCVADYDKLMPGWNHLTQFTVAVVNQDAKKSKYSDTLHRFCKKEHDWGWKKYMELLKVVDGFTIADTLVIRAQVQVILDKPLKPFRCLDPQYRRELVRVYLSHVESICRRFCEDKRVRLSWAREDEALFREFWAALSPEQQHKYVTDKNDRILKGMVKQFFNEREVTSTLVMDALYSGCKQIDEHSRSWSEARGAVGAPMVVIRAERNHMSLHGDLMVIADKAHRDFIATMKEDSKDLAPSDGLTLRSGQEGEDVRRDVVDHDEQRLAELGRRAVEMYVLAHLFTDQLEPAFGESEALKLQNILIAEEDKATQAELRRQEARLAAEKERKAKKKEQERAKAKKEAEKARQEAAELKRVEAERRLEAERKQSEASEKKRLEDEAQAALHQALHDAIGALGVDDQQQPPPVARAPQTSGRTPQAQQQQGRGRGGGQQAAATAATAPVVPLAARPSAPTPASAATGLANGGPAVAPAVAASGPPAARGPSATAAAAAAAAVASAASLRAAQVAAAVAPTPGGGEGPSTSTVGPHSSASSSQGSQAAGSRVSSEGGHARGGALVKQAASSSDSSDASDASSNSRALLEADLQAARSRVRRLELTLADRDSEIGQLKAQVQELQQQVLAAQQARDAAVALAAAPPSVPAPLEPALSATSTLTSADSGVAAPCPAPVAKQEAAVDVVQQQPPPQQVVTIAEAPSGQVLVASAERASSHDSGDAPSVAAPLANGGSKPGDVAVVATPSALPTPAVAPLAAPGPRGPVAPPPAPGRAAQGYQPQLQRGGYANGMPNGPRAGGNVQQPPSGGVSGTRHMNGTATSGQHHPGGGNAGGGGARGHGRGVAEGAPGPGPRPAGAPSAPQLPPEQLGGPVGRPDSGRGQPGYIQHPAHNSAPGNNHRRGMESNVGVKVVPGGMVGGFAAQQRPYMPPTVQQAAQSAQQQGGSTGRPGPEGAGMLPYRQAAPGPGLGGPVAPTTNGGMINSGAGGVRRRDDGLAGGLAAPPSSGAPAGAPALLAGPSRHPPHQAVPKAEPAGPQPARNMMQQPQQQPQQQQPGLPQQQQQQQQQQRRNMPAPGPQQVLAKQRPAVLMAAPVASAHGGARGNAGLDDFAHMGLINDLLGTD